MTFYNNRGAIAHIDEGEVYLFRHVDNQILMDHYIYDKEGRQDKIVEDTLGEFDIQISEEDKIYLIYQDTQRDLWILLIDKEIKERTRLSEGGMPKVFELNMFQTSDTMNIVYLTLESSGEGIFNIHHHMLKGDKWVSHLVEEIRVDKVLNPIRILTDGVDILLFYYQGNQINLKKFSMENMEWGSYIPLGDTNRKLYMDVFKDDVYIHIVYSEYSEENLRIKYMRYLYDGDFLIKEREEILSNEGNPSNPTIIKEDNTIWIVWNESSNLYSRYSLDNGDSWSNIYFWKESRTNNIMRYKYIGTLKGNTILEHTFGTIYPEIKFLGFGPLNNIEEITPKKKLMESIFKM